MTARRTLVLTPRLPWPLDDGGRIGLWQITWSAATHMETRLLSMVRPGEAAELPAEFKARGVTLRTVPHAPAPLPMTALTAWRSPLPITLQRYRSAAYETAVREEVSGFRPDVVLINHLHLAPYAHAVHGALLVLREHNVESIWLERLAAAHPRPWLRAFVRDQARRMRVAERDLCERMDLVLAVQAEEAGQLRQLAPRACVETLPVGVDFGRFSARDPSPEPTLLLVASFGWEPNQDGATRFLREGWPLIRRELPGARLRLVGQGIPGPLARLAGEHGADVIGRVPDVAAEFARAHALVVPLWVGAGARVKIIEAMAARLPVVSTPLGAEGLELVDPVHVRLGASARELALAACQVLRDPLAARGMAERAHAHAEASWSLARIAQRMTALIERAGGFANAIRAERP